MAKVNFREIIMHDVAGNEFKADLHYDLCNTMYLRGDVKESPLGLRIFNTEGACELSDEEVKIVRKYAGLLFSPVFCSAIEKVLESGQEGE